MSAARVLLLGGAALAMLYGAYYVILTYGWFNLFVGAYVGISVLLLSFGLVVVLSGRYDG